VTQPGRDATVDELARKYRDTTVAAAAAAGSPRRANRLFDENRGYARELQRTEDGRAVIEEMLDDPEVAVRMKAAAHVLTWAPHRAEPVLEELAAGGTNRTFEAKMTLREYRAGRMKLEL
jgi:uncharacterized protein DUF2019